GGALVLPGAEANRDPAQWSELLTQHRVTIWNSVPALMAMQAEYGLPSDHALRLIMMSGDWVPVELVKALRERAPRTAIVALGGATEAAIWSNAHEVGELDPAWTSIPYGTPLAGQMLHVVNGRGEDCPDWVIGEIEISGSGVARGYWRDAALTATKFRTDPTTGERRYRTGDLGRFRPYGTHGPTPIEFLGREDFQVKVQGYRIELGEIETALASHPDVQQVVVTALPTAGDKALHAFVVLRPEAGERTRFLLERHGLRRLPQAARVALPRRPEPEDYDRRRSVRRFTPGNVGGDVLRTLLTAAKTTLDARVIARRVEGQSSSPMPTCTVPDAGTARIAAAAAFLIVLEAPAGMSRHAALLEAGAAGQRLMTAAHTLDIGLCPIGVLMVDSKKVLHAFAGGIPASETAGFDLAGMLREQCAAQLPPWMVPRHVHFVSSLPLSTNGKVDRGALRPLVEAPAASAPTNDALTGKVAALAAEVLGQPVQPRQNLFDCGATSLHIVRLQRKLAEQLGSRLAVVDLFRLPTVAALAGAIAGDVETDAVDAGLARAARRRQMRAPARQRGDAGAAP
ncbi:MAG: AMP-binding protein, partial [Proteobacteria bacterium]|nr:AMP-binding protein [Pseudomonadota bacterium]